MYSNSRFFFLVWNYKQAVVKKKKKKIIFSQVLQLKKQRSYKNSKLILYKEVCLSQCINDLLRGIYSHCVLAFSYSHCGI